MTLEKRIRQFREEKGLAQNALAKSFSVIKSQTRNQNKMISLFDDLSEYEQRSLIKEMQN